MPPSFREPRMPEAQFLRRPLVANLVNRDNSDTLAGSNLSNNESDLCCISQRSPSCKMQRVAKDESTGTSAGGTDRKWPSRVSPPAEVHRSIKRVVEEKLGAFSIAGLVVEGTLGEVGKGSGRYSYVYGVPLHDPVEGAVLELSIPRRLANRARGLERSEVRVRGDLEPNVYQGKVSFRLVVREIQAAEPNEGGEEREAERRLSALLRGWSRGGRRFPQPRPGSGDKLLRGDRPSHTGSRGGDRRAYPGWGLSPRLRALQRRACCRGVDGQGRLHRQRPRSLRRRYPPRSPLRPLLPDPDRGGGRGEGATAGRHPPERRVRDTLRLRAAEPGHQAPQARPCPGLRPSWTFTTAPPLRGDRGLAVGHPQR